MPSHCSAYGCKSRYGVVNTSFHKYPRDDDIRKQWIIATKRKNFTPSSYAVLCGKHFTEDMFVPSTAFPKLYPNAVPTIFESLPSYYQSPPKRPRTVQRIVNTIIDITIDATCDTSATTSDTAELATSSSTDELSELQKENKRLTVQLAISRRRNRLKNYRLRRMRNRISSLKDLTTRMKSLSLISNKVQSHLLQTFDNDSDTLVQHLTNKGHKPKEFPSCVREFACALFYRSPSAYRFVRKYFQLPGPSTIRGWFTNNQCNPGFTEQAFVELGRKTSSA